MKTISKLKSLLLILLSLSILSGCSSNNYEPDTITYNLNISKTFDEKIVFALPKNAYDLARENENPDITSTSLEYSILKERQEPIFSNHDTYYKKHIKKSSDKVIATLTYNYLEKEFMYAQYITQCFENYEFNSTDDYFEIKLSGQFSCLNDKNIEINITSPYEVEKTNGTKIDNYYTWSITDKDYQDTNIEYKIKRDSKQMATKHESAITQVFSKLKPIILIILIVILLVIIYKIYKKKKEEIEEI